MPLVARAVALILGVLAGCEGSAHALGDSTGTSSSEGGSSSSSDGSSSSDSSSSSSSSGSDAADSTGTPTCCGCLCSDPRWSCSDSTCVDDDGHALALTPEAGFFEIAGGNIALGGWSGTAPTDRVFYSFHPADDAPETRPLLVFFNGGPGESTAILFGLNTAPVTLDPDRGGPTLNPDSWTQFASLLHIDAPSTGFSYTLPAPSGARPSPGLEVSHDAATFVRAVLRFLAGHPQLDASRVVLVGESFGGTRATAMLQHLLFHAEIGDSDYPDVALAEEIVAYYDRVLGPGTHAPAEVADKFAAVLIQPLVACEAQKAMPSMMSCQDPYQCDEPPGTVDALLASLREQLLDPEILANMLDVDPDSIEWFHATQRTDAYARPQSPEEREDEAALAQILGALGREDGYYETFNDQVFAPSGYPDYCPLWDGHQFLRVAALVPVLVTHAELDGSVPSASLPPALATLTDVLTDVTHEPTLPIDAERPGQLRLAYGDGSERVIRFPFYAGAGHPVTWRRGPELAADVQAWLSEHAR